MSNKPQNIGIILIDKTGTLTSLKVKEFNEDELYKKCNFKKPDDFIKQTEWKLKTEGKKFLVSVYGKTEGKANMENKYDFPPPIDSTLFFGSCALVCQQIKDDGSKEYISLSVEQWDKFYEKLFGGFENLADTAAEDEEEEDELAAVPADKKTKHGYLKDDFVVDDDADEDAEDEDFSEGDEESDEMDDSGSSDEQNDDLEGELEDFGSELSEEEYDYDTDSVSE
jgi:hypothetical protein